MFLFGLLGVEALDGSAERVEPEACGVALVEERTAEQFDIAELACGELTADDGALAVGDGGAQMPGNVDEDAVDGFQLLLRIDRGRSRDSAQVFYIYIIRYAREIVGIDKSKFLREAEEDVPSDGGVGHDDEAVAGGVADGGAAEETGEGMVLKVEL